jgi:hypothetical protein
MICSKIALLFSTVIWSETIIYILAVNSSSTPLSRMHSSTSFSSPPIIYVLHGFLMLPFHPCTPLHSPRNVQTIYFSPVINGTTALSPPNITAVTCSTYELGLTNTSFSLAAQLSSASIMVATSEAVGSGISLFIYASQVRQVSFQLCDADPRAWGTCSI